MARLLAVLTILLSGVLLCYAGESRDVPDQSSPNVPPAIVPAVVPEGDGAPEGGIQQTQVTQPPVVPPTTFPPAPPPTPPAAQAQVDRVSGTDTGTRGPTTDTGSLINKANVPGVATQRRTPTTNDSRTRGSHTGQTLAGGSYWVPARQDLDTALSKLDSSLIDQVRVIKGPYSALYGPGFNYIYTDLARSPRFLDGLSWQGQSRVNFQTNGQQWFGAQTLLVGDADWGFRADYGHRTGNDYRAGNGSDIPASYNSRDFYGALGFDLSPCSHLEINYLHLDQTGVEFPAQAFDMDFLVTDAFEIKYTLDDQPYFDRLALETWYNRTSFAGNSQGAGKRRQNPLLNLFAFTGFTDVGLESTGYNAALTWGRPEQAHCTAGTDLRVVRQEINEFNRFRSRGFNLAADPGFNPTRIPATSTADPAVVESVFPTALNSFDKRVPGSYLANPGLFAEYVLPLDCLRLQAGGRFDWVSTTVTDRRPIQQFTLPGLFIVPDPARPGQLEPSIPLVPGAIAPPRDFLPDRDFSLWSLYLSGEYKVNDHCTALGSVGYSMRPPTLTELYSLNGPFLGILQRGSNFVFGNPGLDAERLWQLDLGVKAEYGRFRAGVNGFYAWVQDYITLRAIIPIPDLPPSFAIVQQAGVVPQPVQFINTPLATLWGGEVRTEFDATPWLTPFVTVSYVEGTDQRRSQSGVSPPGVILPLGLPFPVPGREPLPGIPPLDSRLGVRLHEPQEKPRWAVEVGARLVARQDRISRTLGEIETPGFLVVDLRSYWQATPNLRLMAGVENLTDQNYREHLDLRTPAGFFQPGVSFYVGGELTFGPGGRTSVN